MESSLRDSKKTQRTGGKEDLAAMIVQHIHNSATMPIIAAIDTVGYKKKPANREIGAIRNRLSGSGAHIETNIYSLAKYMEQGVTVQGALLRDKLEANEDTDSRFIQQQLFCIDIDNTGERQLTTPEAIQSVCKAAGITPAIIAESFSSSEKLRKYHAFFISDKPVKDAETARSVILHLQDVFEGAADPACKDPARIVYGTAPDKQVIISGGYTPIEALTAPEPKQQRQENTPAPAPQSKAKHNNSEYQQAEPVDLLGMIDVNALSYEEYLSVLCSFKAAGGSLEDFLAWDSAYNGKKRDFLRADAKMWKSAHGKKHTIAGLKHFAALHSPAAYAAYIAERSPAPDDLRQRKPKTAKQGSSGEAAENGSQNPYNKDGSGKLTETNLRHSLEVLGISVKFNAILHQTEISGKCLEEYSKEAYSAVLPVFLYDKLQHYLKGVTIDKIGSYINNITFSKQSVCNPILEKIDGTTWEGSDKLTELYEIMHIDAADKLSRLLLRKWLIQCYCALHNELDNPFSVDEVLVLVGQQGYGKTRLLEKLSLNRLYFGEGMCYDPRNKDSQIQAVSKWIGELGEIGSTLKKDINAVKAFISLSVDEYRAPYGKTSVKYARKTCFCGSTNDMRFLIDETGNRRFFAVKLPDNKFIDVKSDKFKKFNVLQLWAQIKHIVDAEISNGETYASAFRLSREELEQLEARNVAHTKLLKGELEIVDILSKATTPENGYELGEGYFTPTQFKDDHSELSRYSSEQVGKVLKKLGYVVARKRVPNTNSVATFYKLPYRKWLGNSANSAI